MGRGDGENLASVLARAMGTGMSQVGQNYAGHKQQQKENNLKDQLAMLKFAKDERDKDLFNQKSDRHRQIMQIGALDVQTAGVQLEEAKLMTGMTLEQRTEYKVDQARRLAQAEADVRLGLLKEVDKLGISTSGVTQDPPGSMSDSERRQRGKDFRQSEMTRLANNVMGQMQGHDPDKFNESVANGVLPSNDPVALSSLVQGEFGGGWFGDPLFPNVSETLDSLGVISSTPVDLLASGQNPYAGMGQPATQQTTIDAEITPEEARRELARRRMKKDANTYSATSVKD